MVAATNLVKEAQAFLTALYDGESGGDYTILFGGKPNDPATPHFNDGTPSLPGHYGFPDWPGAETSAGKTHAAGAPQFEPATWLDTCTRLFPAGSTPNFRNPADQDWGAWLLAKDVYHRAIGGDLGIILHAGVLGGIANTLKSTWTSLSESTFPDRYKAALMADTPPAPTVAPAEPSAPPAAPSAPADPFAMAIEEAEKAAAVLQARLDKMNAAIAAMKEAST